MQHRAFPKVGDRGQPDMRMRAHGDGMFAAKHGRADVVEEDEGTDATTVRIGQHTADGESTEVVQAGSEELGHGLVLLSGLQ